MSGSSTTAFPVEPAQLRKLKRPEYERLVDMGAFEDERLELLRGVLVTLSPQRAPHASTVQKLSKLLGKQLETRLEVRTQLPLALADDSEPEPDIALVSPGDYDHAHPTTAALVIEVADTSLGKDRMKAEIYAAAGIPEYWIVDLQRRSVEVYRAPAAGRYGELRTLHEADTLVVAACPDVTIAIAEILPRPLSPPAR